MRRSDLISSAEACRRRFGYPGVSVDSWPNATVREIAYKVKEIRDRTRTRLLMHGDLRKQPRAGYAVRASGRGIRSGSARRAARATTHSLSRHRRPTMTG